MTDKEKTENKKEKAAKVISSDSPEIEEITPSLEEMLKAGVHFGHRTSKWSSKMEPYIFGSRNNIHIIDLESSREKLKEALAFLRHFKIEKKTIVFVGTKVSAKENTVQAAQEAGAPYVSERWIGGTLTNFPVISKRLDYFRELERKREGGELKKYTKKEQHDFNVELQKLEGQFGGLKKLVQMPDALLVVDVHKEKSAVKEARSKNIPVVGICDTNANPTLVDYPVPANDDAISSLRLMLGAMAKALK